MGKKKGGKGKKGKGPARAGTRAVEGPGSDKFITYRGSIHPRGWLSNKSVIAKELRSYTTCTSSAGGIYNGVFDQTMTNFSNWTSFAAVWDEYRVLKMILEFMPANMFSKATTIATGPGIVVVDRDSNGPLTSLGNATSYESARLATFELPWTDGSTVKADRIAPPSWSMDGVNDATWITTSTIAPATKPCIKTYFTGLTASTTYGAFVLRALVQFRGQF